MSIADQNRIKALENRVAFLEEKFAEFESARNKQMPDEPALDKRTREYRIWKNANSSAS